MGSGINVGVMALAVFDDGSGIGPALYAGGPFDTAGGMKATRIARWDGTSWQPVGKGVEGAVFAMTVFDDGSGSGPGLYAAGGFTSAGGTAANYIARWDGTAWSPLGSGLDGRVSALEVFDDGSGTALYAGGSFASAGGMAAYQIARWDGTAWSPLGSGMDGTSVRALAVFDDGTGNGPALYAGGSFTTAGGVEASHIANWDGASWAPVGEGTSASVYALGAFDDGSGNGPRLYAGGSFISAGDATAGRVAKWNGLNWSSLDGGAEYHIYALSTFDDGLGSGPALYAGGRFGSVGGVAARLIAKWDGQQWSPLGSGMEEESSYGAVLALAVFNDGSGAGPALYAGGYFDTAGGVPADSIARWDGTVWQPLGAGVDRTVWALVVFDDGSGGGPALYAGGYFTEAGGVAVNKIAKWDGSEWAALDAGLNGSVRALAVFDDGAGKGPALYAAGNFPMAGGVSASGVARWDGSSWSALGSGINVEPHRSVYTLAVYDDGHGPDLYAGGYFTRAGGGLARGIARWSGSSWSSVGGGVAGSVHSLAVFDDGFDVRSGLYAGGYFKRAGVASASSIARFNGAFWTPLGDGIGGFDPFVLALADFDDGSTDGPALFAGGAFTTAGGMSSLRIAKWVGCPIDSPPRYPTCRYEVTIIQAPPDGSGRRPSTYGTDLNNLGHVVGFYGHFNRAFLWEGGPEVITLEQPPQYRETTPRQINDMGQIAGSFWGYGAADNRAFVYDDGKWTILSPPAGGAQSGARAINLAGEVVGYRSQPDLAAEHGFVWQNGKFVDIIPPGSSSSTALGINDHRQVVGIMYPGPRGFVWQQGKVTDLGVLPDGDVSYARAINNRRQIVGSSRIPDPGGSGTVYHAVLWSKRRVSDLGTLPGYRNSFAVDINDSGQIVGESYNSPHGGLPDAGFIWQDGKMLNLNDVIPWELRLHISSTASINNAGKIVARASGVAVLLTPIKPPKGDINGNCRVDDNDLVLLLYEWGQSGSPADLDGDGTVGVPDLLILLQNWMG